MSRRVVVTGGASFIGSHVVERLLTRGDKVIVLDDLSSGNLHWLSPFIKDLDFVGMDLREDYLPCKRVMKGVDIVYHLAADHGGRGYVDYKQLNCSNNFVIDHNVFSAAKEADVETIIFASSGCIYPLNLQTDPDELIYLTEESAGPPYYPDGLYGMAKLVGELILARMRKEGGPRSCSCRFFTVYGPRAKENHAIIAMIARSFIQQNPFEVWGDGTQIRNWTYIDDIADGMVASEKLAKEQGAAVINLGTMERIRVRDAVDQITSLAGYSPEIRLRPDMPTGPLNRVADSSRMMRDLGIEPVPFVLGVKKTFDWYYETHNRAYVTENLERLLIERK